MVNHIMVFRHDFDPAEPLPSIRLPPMPEQCQYFYPKDGAGASYLDTDKKLRLYTCSFTGTQTTGVNLKLGHSRLVIKVSFQPDALYRLLGIPMHMLLRIEAYDAVDIMGNSLHDLTQQIHEAAGIPEMIGLIEKYVLKQQTEIKERLPIDKVLSILIKRGGLTPIDELTADSHRKCNDC